MARLTRKNAGSSHSYTIDGKWVPGVTTVIGILDKPSLKNWTASQAAAFADEHWGRLTDIRSADRIKEITEAWRTTNRKAVTRGHRIHAMAEKISHGETVDLPADIAPAVKAVADMLDQHDMRTLHTELSLGSTDYLYAGTGDAIVEHPRWGTCLIDYKTGKGVYTEVGLQLAAYRFADLALVPRTVVGPRGGVKTVLDEIPAPHIDHVMAVHVHTTDVELIPVKADTSVFSAFLSILDVFNAWTLRASWNYRDRDTYDTPIGAPIGGPESDLPEGF